MSSSIPDLNSNNTFTDSKYDVDVVVKFISDSVVLLREIETGNQRLCGKEEFTDNTRFRPHD